MDEPISLAMDLDPVVLAFAVAVSLATGIVFGLVPAFQASRGHVAGTLQDERGSLASSRRKSLTAGHHSAARVCRWRRFRPPMSGLSFKFLSRCRSRSGSGDPQRPP